ncbi:hypothetical protein C8F04DRAFT_1192875 [Mycena alexandri]|uniref:Uncharacterized protein n=1 Tax=Mycena alexandri TaxID=1745969 RepID=A0AAD6SB71_9AGAR|nr:hypothetical protein C8F04DRAFT_1192875 [Mycena alexandri]
MYEKMVLNFRDDFGWIDGGEYVENVCYRNFKDMGQPNDQTPSEPELRAGQNGTRDRGRMMKIGGLDDTTRQVMRERTALVFGDRQRDEGSGPDQRCDGSDVSGLRIGVIRAPERRSVGVRSAGVSERGAQRTGGPE